MSTVTSHKHKFSVIEKALSTMNRAQVNSPYEAPTNAQPCMQNNLYEVPSASPYEMVESIETEQQVYETPCEGEQSIGPVYYAPSSDEKKIYEEFEGKRFRKLFREQLV